MIHRTDKNQAEIVDYLRRTGRTVISLSQVGGGCPDILVGYRGVNFLFEIKSERGKLSESQVEMHDNWRGKIHVVRSIEDAEEILRE